MNIEQIEEALSKLTQGPWVSFKDEDAKDDCTHSICSMAGEHVEGCPTEEPYKNAHCHECVVWETYIKPNDAAFIAKAPEYVAWLIARVRSLSSPE